MKITVKTSDGKKFSEARFRNAQDKVKEGYKTRFKLKPEEVASLHMFFSPSRIPKGLTEKEVRKVLSLYSVRDAHRRQKVNGVERVPGTNLPKFYPMVDATLLPKELIGGGRMTRALFQKGITKLLEQLAPV